ncbi:MAG: ferrous iron transport protein A [Magnetococcales bacterium]|nr:ferrous iron transport protein A [Magnetococcales bacterium]
MKTWKKKTLHKAKKRGDNVTLADLKQGEKALIMDLKVDNSDASRLVALGIVKGAEVALDKKAPMGDPRIYSVVGYRLALRNDIAQRIVVAPF